MAANSLRENEIPFYRQQETSGGLRLAMPFQPAMGPGTWYSILVPEEVVDEARRILNELPIEVNNNPDVWHFGPSEKVKRGWSIYIWISLILSCIFLVFYLMGLLN
jgi:hypothetical protein